MISAAEARKIDGLVKGYGNEFIWSPTTCVADSKAMCKVLAEDLEQTGKVEIKRGAQYVKTVSHKDTYKIQLKNGEIVETQYLINSAG